MCYYLELVIIRLSSKDLTPFSGLKKKKSGLI